MRSYGSHTVIVLYICSKPFSRQLVECMGQASSILDRPIYSTTYLLHGRAPESQMTYPVYDNQMFSNLCFQ